MYWLDIIRRAFMSYTSCDVWHPIFLFNFLFPLLLRLLSTLLLQLVICDFWFRVFVHVINNGILWDFSRPFAQLLRWSYLVLHSFGFGREIAIILYLLFASIWFAWSRYEISNGIHILQRNWFVWWPWTITLVPPMGIKFSLILIFIHAITLTLTLTAVRPVANGIGSKICIGINIGIYAGIEINISIGIAVVDFIGLFGFSSLDSLNLCNLFALVFRLHCFNYNSQRDCFNLG